MLLNYIQKLQKQVQKRLCDISKKYHNKCIDTELYHLLCIVGVRPGGKLEKNKFVFDEVNDLLSVLKSKLMSKTKLTFTSASHIEEHNNQNNNSTNVNDTDTKEKLNKLKQGF